MSKGISCLTVVLTLLCIVAAQGTFGDEASNFDSERFRESHMEIIRSIAPTSFDMIDRLRQAQEAADLWNREGSAESVWKRIGQVGQSTEPLLLIEAGGRWSFDYEVMAVFVFNDSAIAVSCRATGATSPPEFHENELGTSGKYYLNLLTAMSGSPLLSSAFAQVSDSGATYFVTYFYQEEKHSTVISIPPAHASTKADRSKRLLEPMDRLFMAKPDDTLK